jgi:PadR family transcriptional regulator, regulatory protein PadR
MVDSPWPSQWMRGALELCVLALVSEDATYGYAVAQRLEAAGFGRVKGGTLYPILLRLEEDGLVVSEWREGHGGPGRKFFSITDRGREQLRRRLADWRAFAATTEALLDSVAKET